MRGHIPCIAAYTVPVLCVVRRVCWVSVPAESSAPCLLFLLLLLLLQLQSHECVDKVRPHSHRVELYPPARVATPVPRTPAREAQPVNLHTDITFNISMTHLVTVCDQKNYAIATLYGKKKGTFLISRTNDKAIRPQMFNNDPQKL